MVLDNLVNSIIDKYRRLSERFDHLYYSTLAYLTVRALDITATSLGMHEYGISAELNPVTSVFVEQFGIEAGLIVKALIFTSPVPVVGHMLNKEAEQYFQDSDSWWKNNLGSIAVYGMASGSVPIVINNFAQYFYSP